MASASKNSAHTLSTEDRKQIPATEYVFPKERKEPLTDESHVRNAIARFDQVEGVSKPERKAAFRRIKTAAKQFKVDMTETSASQLGSKPHTPNEAAKKAMK